MKIDLDELIKKTDGRGVFTATISNSGAAEVKLEVAVSLINPPKGYQNLMDINPVVIKLGSGSAVEVKLPVPIIGDRTTDLEAINQVEAMPTLPINSYVIVSASRGGWDFNLNHAMVYKTSYLDNTRLIKIPKEVLITVNYNRDRLLRNWLI
jgi:hypothetical protein